ncbi:CinA family protein [Streptomyces sp. VRA16 Mangrove soil]|uniref:CinA family protein n=1 Tax=Streptomyces sp. VRA16 Mangrove soil TaxID=2817434 RepID=UPI001A9FFD5D|nr:CinA family protein [Streptomyces sp. VRA16 Mangrove soil]MBO1335851.1 CinA family protein [Streptomyces sp. VRA16 Mangrove soil]
MTYGAAEALRLLTERGETLAVAESLTGGLVAAELVSVPGASKAFRGSVTAYATELKHELLGVDDKLLAAHGPVHPEVALQMAAGVRDALGADWGIATTGVAGPDPQDGQPVGTVFVAVAGPQAAGTDSSRFARNFAGSRKVLALRLNGDRAEIRRESVRSVLGLLTEELVGGHSGEPTGNARAQDTEQNGGF